MDLSLGLEGSHVLITGAAGHIGSALVSAFLAAGCKVSALDIRGADANSCPEGVHWYVVDITDETAVENAFTTASKYHGPVSTCIAVAGVDLSYLPHPSSICEMELGQWQGTNKVNGEGTFLTARAWLRGIKAAADSSLRNVSLVIIGSEAGVFGVTGNADYAASKSAIQYGLVRSLMKDAVTVHLRARVNAIAPGAVHTQQFDKECEEDSRMMYVEAQATVAMRVPVPIEQVARCCLFLASERWSGSITGQVIRVDGGKSGRLFWEEDT